MKTPLLNADAIELSHFDAIAKDWWDPKGSFKTLHDINPLRLEFITQALDLQGKNLADIGCGGGILSEALAKNAAQITAIDASEKAIEAAKQHALDAGLSINYQCQMAEELAELSPGYFDAVTCMELLEHVPDPLSIIHACSSLLKPGGDVFFSTINRNVKAYLFAILGAEYLLKLLPKGIHTYAKFIRPAELAKWSREAGLNLVRIIGINYHPLKRSYELSAKTDVNYIIHCKKD